MILVTGITGLTGRFLYNELKKTNLKVKYLVRKSSNTSFMNRNDNIVYGDNSDFNNIKNLFDGVSTVLHLAPRGNLHSVLAAAKNNGIKRFYFISSTGVYSKFKSSTHIDIKNEEALKNSGLEYTIIRPSMIYGNSQDGNIKMLVKIINNTRIFPVIGKGNGLMHPIYAKDLAKVIVSALENDNLTKFKEYDVAGKAPTQYIDLLKLISKNLNKKVYFAHFPFKLALTIGKIGDIVKNPLLTHEKVLRIEEDKNFDYSLAKRELGFNPIPFEEGIKLEVEALKKAKYI